MNLRNSESIDFQAVAISHYSVIANTLQIRAHNYSVETKANIPTDQWKFRPGDVITGGESVFSLCCGVSKIILLQYFHSSVSHSYNCETLAYSDTGYQTFSVLF